uniref:Uncharacterized protein n=1 Tax=Globodera rostochiensis TaxID=31243 RepID=A0A914H1P8_GLORO
MWWSSYTEFQDIMATACKLEMSLDEIIKANKSKTNRVNVRPNVRKIQIVGKRSPIGAASKKMPIGRRQFGGQQLIKKNFGIPKRVAFNSRGNRPIGKINRGGGVVSVRKNVALQNSAVISATKNLVNKLVKKALSQSNVATVASLRSKRFPVNRLQRSRTIVLNKINRRSRVISRQRVPVQHQQQPIMVQRVVRGRGPIRFASTTSVVSPARNNVPKRLRRVNFNQRQPVVLVQQQPSQAVQRFVPSFSSMSVRDHINALRRANTVQQLQTRFVNQQQIQQQPQGHPFAAAYIRRPRKQGNPFASAYVRNPRKQQLIVDEPFQSRPQFSSPIVVQQRGPPRRVRQQPPQYVIVQQPSRGQRPQFRGKPQQFFRRQQQQSNVVFDPAYEPPNFLQRVPTTSGTFLQY